MGADLKKKYTQRNLKITVVGDKAIGKTSLLKTYCTGVFPKGEYVSTVFPFISDEDYVYSRSAVYNGCPLLLAMWDRVYNRAEDDLIRSLQYDQTDVFLLCFSVVDKASFSNAVTLWKSEIRRHCPRTPIILLGLKKDLRNAKQSCPSEITTRSAGNDMADRIGAVAYLECSAKRKEGLKEVFSVAVQTAMKSPPAKQKRRNSSSCTPGLVHLVNLL